MACSVRSERLQNDTGGPAQSQHSHSTVTAQSQHTVTAHGHSTSVMPAGTVADRARARRRIAKGPGGNIETPISSRTVERSTAHGVDGCGRARAGTDGGMERRDDARSGRSPKDGTRLKSRNWGSSAVPCVSLQSPNRD